MVSMYESLKDLVISRGGTYVPLIVHVKTPDDIITELFNLNHYCSTFLRSVPKHIDKIPVDGNWYMVTVTQPSSETEPDIMLKHDQTMEYFEYNKITVYLAALEHAGAWHIHYAVCSSQYAKNIKRDLCKLLSVKVIDQSKKVRNLREFNGLCNYVLKRNYPDDKTHIRTLVERLEYKEGFGWDLKK